MCSLRQIFSKLWCPSSIVWIGAGSLQEIVLPIRKKPHSSNCCNYTNDDNKMPIWLHCSCFAIILWLKYPMLLHTCACTHRRVCNCSINWQCPLRMQSAGYIYFWPIWPLLLGACGNQNEKHRFCNAESKGFLWSYDQTSVCVTPFIKAHFCLVCCESLALFLRLHKTIFLSLRQIRYRCYREKLAHMRERYRPVKMLVDGRSWKGCVLKADWRCIQDV